MDQRGLVERARKGDHDAFTALVDLTLVRLDSAARLIVRDPELARDAVQDTFIRAWRDLPGLRDPDRFDAWLHRLIVHACLDLARRRRRRVIEVELTPSTCPPQPTWPATSPIATCSKRRSRASTPSIARLSSCITSLACRCPRWQRPIGIPLGTAKSRLHYALAAMRLTVLAEPIPTNVADPRRTSGMTSERRFDQDLPDLLAQVAQAPAPDYRDLIVQQTDAHAAAARLDLPRKVASHVCRHVSCGRRSTVPAPDRGRGRPPAHRPDRGRRARRGLAASSAGAVRPRRGRSRGLRRRR